MRLDYTIFFFLRSFVGKSHIFDSLVIFCAEYLPYFIYVGVLVAILLLAHDRLKLKESLAVISSLIISKIVLIPIIWKFFDRARPYVAYKITPLILASGLSFPSSHATVFFSLAGLFFFYRKKWFWVLAVLALIISISRVIAGVHYPSDILGGMVLGLAVGLVLSRILLTRRV